VPLLRPTRCSPDSGLAAPLLGVPPAVHRSASGCEDVLRRSRPARRRAPRRGPSGYGCPGGV